MQPPPLPLIVNCWNSPADTFFAPHFRHATRWQFVNALPQSPLERLITHPPLARLRAGRQAARLAAAEDAALVISHDPRVSRWCEHFLARRKRDGTFRGQHLAFAFNFPELPPASRRRSMARAFATIDRFVVYSTLERHLYHDAFGIPLDKLSFIPWGVNPPPVESPATPLEPGDYVTSIGGNGRDYPTLLAAARLLPAVRFVLVARPHNLAGLPLPANVTLHTNLPLPRTMNLLKFSRFTIVPLAGSEVPAGHVTLVNAMHLGKAFVITASAGVADYVRDHDNALTVPPHSPDALAAAIARLWSDPAEADRLGTAGLRFAQTHCTEEATRAWLEGYFQSLGILPDLHVSTL